MRTSARDPLAPFERRPRREDPACALGVAVRSAYGREVPGQGAWRADDRWGLPCSTGLPPSTRPAPLSGGLLPLGLCTVSDPHQRWGKNLQAGEKDLSPLESPPWLAPSEPSILLHKTQPAGFTDQVMEAGSWPRSHNTAGPKTRLPDSQPWELHFACSSPLSPGTPGELEWRQDSGQGGRAFVCYPPSFSSHRPGGRWGGDNCSLSCARLHCLPRPVLALRTGSPAGNPSPAP